MTRSKWKGPFLNKSLLKKNLKSKVWSRGSTIPYFLIGFSVFVHSGKEFRKIFITREKVGFKFGEFVFTRKLKKKEKK
jgi:small subunit ribosomal protein S19